MGDSILFPPTLSSSSMKMTHGVFALASPDKEMKLFCHVISKLKILGLQMLRAKKKRFFLSNVIKIKCFAYNDRPNFLSRIHYYLQTGYKTL